MNALLQLIEKFEGMHKRLPSGLIGPYICPAGVPTQGLGLVVESLLVPPITEEEARKRCNSALPYYIGETLKICPNLAKAPPDVRDAIVDFVFNLGPARLRASTLRKAVLAEDWDWACTELKKWVRGGGRILPGLVARREAEASLIRRAMQQQQNLEPVESA